MLADLIRSAQPCVALTGAGVSTESGIPDFRSARGLWREVDPFQVASIEAFQEDPERVWEWYAARIDLLTGAEPNAAHRALAQLEHDGLLRAVVTQNIDLLHGRAGSRDVVEVHGSILTAVCLSCGARLPLAGVRRLLPLPRCGACGAVLKPDVVLFGELVPDRAMARATQLAREAALLLVVGSSLEVWPVAGLPQETLSAGGRLAIVNRGPTPYDGAAALTLDAAAGEILAETARLLSA
jgi:NAD-dependent deacetylase